MTEEERARVGDFFAGLMREVLAAGWRYDRERRLWLLPSGEVAGGGPQGVAMSGGGLDHERFAAL